MRVLPVEAALAQTSSPASPLASNEFFLMFHAPSVSFDIDSPFHVKGAMTPLMWTRDRHAQFYQHMMENPDYLTSLRDEVVARADPGAGCDGIKLAYGINYQYDA